MRNEAPGADPLDTYAVTISGGLRNDIWSSIQASGLLSASNEVDEELQDGTFAWLVVTADGSTVQVEARNAVHEAISQVLAALNESLPEDKRLIYAPEIRYDWVPGGPCDNYGGKREPMPGGKGPNQWSLELVASAVEEHAGTIAANRFSLQEAVRRGLVTLEGKGGYTGDQVSIGANNTTNPPGQELAVKLYLEFWGAEANAAIANRVKQAIESTWSGKQTTSGKTLKVQVVTIVQPGSTSAPGTAGYHQIQMKSGLPYSSATLFQNYSGAGIGNFETGGANIEKTWAHEAGHLMGQPDHYNDYRKQPDGMWRRESDGQTFAAQQIAAELARKYPGRTAIDMLRWLNQPGTTRTSTPQDGHETDLMATLDGSPSQDDVDALADKAGMLVEVMPGSILVNRNGNDQNFVVTRTTDLYVPKGETKVINGLWVACIDHSDGIPDFGQVFDVAPPLDEWVGYDGATQLGRFLSVGDSLRLYCDWYVQAAIWRLTDNTSVGYESVDALLARTGVIAGDTTFSFPRLSDLVTGGGPPQALVPLQLFHVVFEPRGAQAIPGHEVRIRASVQGPFLPGTTFSRRWSLTPPRGSLTVLADSTAEEAVFVPDRRGFYRLQMRTRIEAAGAAPLDLQAPAVFATAGDAATESFERAALLDMPAFAWETGSSAPWETRSDEVLTGNGAAASAEIGDGQESVLALGIFMPEPDTLRFAVKTSTEYGYDFLTFEVDAVEVDTWSGETDWSLVAVPLAQGEHRLVWAYRKDSSYGDGRDRVWLDDVLFPVNAVTTPLESSDIGQLSLSLDQPFPNPARDAAMLAYSLPRDADVQLEVFDVTGRKVIEIAGGLKPRGRHEVNLRLRGVAPGMLLVRLRVGSQVLTRTILVVR